MNESKISFKEFKELTKDIPEDYMLCFSLNGAHYGAESFEINVSEKRIIIK